MNLIDINVFDVRKSVFGFKLSDGRLLVNIIKL